MYIIKAEQKQIEKIVDMSVRAFETDKFVGGKKGTVRLIMIQWNGIEKWQKMAVYTRL